MKITRIGFQRRNYNKEHLLVGEFKDLVGSSPTDLYVKRFVVSDA